MLRLRIMVIGKAFIVTTLLGDGTKVYWYYSWDKNFAHCHKWYFRLEEPYERAIKYNKILKQSEHE